MTFLEEIEARNAPLYEKARKELAAIRKPIVDTPRDPNYKPETRYIGQEKVVLRDGKTNNMAVFQVNWW